MKVTIKARDLTNDLCSRRAVLPKRFGKWESVFNSRANSILSIF